jgi:ParB family protein of integrating conjugative element (PFGI_1 class)
MNDDQGTLLPVALDQLRAFDLNPRITRNPNYDEIKSSIRNRGLDQPPQITQRPGERHYIIANGGNTRLAILNELWLETHDKKYWNIVCHFHKWRTDQSIEEGNLHCLMGHLIEDKMKGELTFIERALGIQNAINLYQSIKKECSQNETVKMLIQEGYPISQTVLSVMSATITLLLPYIPDLLYSGLTRKHIDQLLALRSNTEKFWDKFCQELPREMEHQLPLFDDIFAMALTSFNCSTAGFSLEHIQDELTGLVSQTLNIDYNSVALVTDAQAQKRTTLLGSEPIPELPDISEQRSVDLKYQKSSSSSLSNESDNIEKNEAINSAPNFIANENDDVNDNDVPTLATTEHGASSDALPNTSAARASLAGEHLIHQDPQFNTPESLASLIEQLAWELAGNAGLEFLISPTETGIFDIASPAGELSNEGKIYWQMLAFLSGKLTGSAVVWRQMLLGSPSALPELSEEMLTKVFQLICYIRRLYEKQHKGELS